MLISIGLFVGFSLLGFPLLMLRGSSRDVFLAPTFGLAASVFVGYAISETLGVSGAEGIALAIALLAIVSISILVSCGARIRTLLPQDSYQVMLGYGLPVLLILLPAITFGVTDFFGAVNYDFFYNSQDSFYLSTHSVREYSRGTDESILPLTGSSSPQGRFAISLVGAFALKFFGINPLHFNSALLSSLVIVSTFAFAAFARNIYSFGSLMSCVAVALVIFSGGFAQGYIYYLLGQISALPLFVAICIFSSRIVDNSNRPKGISVDIRDLLAIVFLLNALYVFYAILSFFALAVTTGALILSALTHKNNVLDNVRALGIILAGSLAAFLLIHISSVGETKQQVIDWVALSIKTAGSESSAVFGEYITEAFMSLLFGCFTYPTTASSYSGLLGAGSIRNWALLAIGALIVTTFLWSLVRIIQSSLMSIGAKSVIGSISIITLSCAIAFFATQAGYAIFKIGSWFIPLLIPVFLASIYVSNTQMRLHHIPFVGFSILILLANVATAANYIVSFLPISDSKFGNVRSLNGMMGVSELKSQLVSFSDRPHILDLKHGIRNAWIANEFRDRTVTALTHNVQPLKDRQLPVVPCSATPTIPQSAILISTQDRQARVDIFATRQIAEPFFQNEHYIAYPASQITRYAAVGRGSYPLETLTASQAKASGFPVTFRWIERGVEIYIYSRLTERIDIELDAVPGFVNGPSPRRLSLQTPIDQQVVHFDKKNTRIRFRAINIEPGMNCFYIESDDDVKRVNRYGALIRAQVSIDSRLLNFALSNIEILPSTVSRE